MTQLMTQLPSNEHHAKPLVAIVGWRGMVGSVLMQRMHQEADFDHIRPRFFSTSNAGARRQWVNFRSLMLPTFRRWPLAM